MTVLLPLYVHPAVAPAAWEPDRLRGTTVVVDGHDDPAYRRVTARLAAAGVPVLGHVDLARATRPLADVLDDVEGWTGHPVGGVFLDRAPTDPSAVGPVALAVRAARRGGLSEVVLNPGTPTDPLYRRLHVGICTFEGGWPDYQRWTGAGGELGDGHLVHSVPPAQLPAARRLMTWRGAGFGLVTDRGLPHPYGGLPSRLDTLTPAG
ncbi:spherulation-specific family 4 protein [Polymorphospora rubra]|uniref:spherulation-specific family 4 protein n=1 Tax=Polymorphospora rubra TaxID=338584 RepID=UPI0033F75310